MSDLRTFIENIRWEKLRPDPEIYYRYTDAGIWYPETLHKPYLKGAVQEMQALVKQYQGLRKMFDPQAEPKA